MSARRKLTVTRCTEMRRGTSKKTGREWIMYAVDAVDETGQSIPDQLNAFSQLPIGELIEYEIDVREHEKYGPSYTLKQPGRGGGGLRAVYERIEAIERDVLELKRRL